MSGLVSTRMGDYLGTPGAVAFEPRDIKINVFKKDIGPI